MPPTPQQAAPAPAPIAPSIKQNVKVVINSLENGYVMTKLLNDQPVTSRIANNVTEVQKHILEFYSSMMP